MGINRKKSPVALGVFTALAVILAMFLVTKYQSTGDTITRMRKVIQETEKNNQTLKDNILLQKLREEFDIKDEKILFIESLTEAGFSIEKYRIILPNESFQLYLTGRSTPYPKLKESDLLVHYLEIYSIEILLEKKGSEYVRLWELKSRK